MKPHYRVWDDFVFRAPLLPFGSPSCKDGILSSPLFREALEVASPDLYDATQSPPSETADRGSGKKQRDRQDFSQLKYLSRASARCTPFGLFAGCGVGRIGAESRIVLNAPSRYRRCTRLDMQYLCALIQHLERVPAVRSQLRFYPNDSLYELGGRLRYVEYHYTNTHRSHKVSAVECDEYLSRLLAGARKGATIAELAALLADEDITTEDAAAYVGEVIDNQLLKSELDPSVVGDDVLTTLIRKLSGLGTPPPELAVLKRIAAMLGGLNTTPPGSAHTLYDEITARLKTLPVGFDRKFLFQTDLYETTEAATVSARVPEELLKTVSFLARISMPYRNATLGAFAEAFYKRFEEREVPLTLALDGELGIGYPAGSGSSGDVSPLIDGLMLPASGGGAASVTVSMLDTVLLRKLLEASRCGEAEIELADADFSGLQPNTQPLPDTLAVMCTLLDDTDDGCRVLLRSAGGSSAANLLGRFCHLDPSLHDLVRRIADKEAELNPGALPVEISHLPESRIGNIASRPRFRKHVLHYLSNTDNRTDDDLTVDDLLLSYRNGRLVLRSKRYGREILPHLTCAHNYSLSPIPVYRFLCDYQTAHVRGGVGFAWNPFFEHLDYLPRVRYGHTVLSRQRWRIKEEELKPVLGASEPQALLSAAAEFIRRRRLTPHAVIPDGDNELFLDLEDAGCWRLLGEIISKRKTMILKEHLFDERTAPVRDAEGRAYVNEMIFAFHKTE